MYFPIYADGRVLLFKRHAPKGSASISIQYSTDTRSVNVDVLCDATADTPVYTANGEDPQQPGNYVRTSSRPLLALFSPSSRPPLALFTSSLEREHVRAREKGRGRESACLRERKEGGRAGWREKNAVKNPLLALQKNSTTISPYFRFDILLQGPVLTLG